MNLYRGVLSVPSCLVNLEVAIVTALAAFLGLEFLRGHVRVDNL